MRVQSNLVTCSSCGRRFVVSKAREHAANPACKANTIVRNRAREGLIPASHAGPALRMVNRPITLIEDVIGVDLSVTDYGGTKTEVERMQRGTYAPRWAVLTALATPGGAGTRKEQVANVEAVFDADDEVRMAIESLYALDGPRAVHEFVTRKLRGMR